MAAGPPLDIVDGGTGAATYSGALVNLHVPLGTITGVVAESGLIGGGMGDVINIGLEEPLQLVHGGTGAINAAQARINLGVIGDAPAVGGPWVRQAGAWVNIFPIDSGLY